MTSPAPDARSLENLHDIVVPAGVAWWPPAPGWYVLGAIVIAATAWSIAVAVQRHRHLRYRRQALTELNDLRRSPHPASAQQAAVILKRTAIHVHSRPRVAALSGTEWLAFLDEHGGRGRFAGDCGVALLEAAYGDSASLDDTRIGKLLDSVEAWIRAQGAPA